MAAKRKVRANAALLRFAQGRVPGVHGSTPLLPRIREEESSPKDATDAAAAVRLEESARGWRDSRG